MNPLAFRRSLQEAWGYTAEVSEYRKSSHAVYRLRYHFVFITKYRKPALRGEIGKEVRDLTREICRSLDIESLARSIACGMHVNALLAEGSMSMITPPGPAYRGLRVPLWDG